MPATVLKRKAVVYVRQSTQTQVQTNLESQRRQFELVDVARSRGSRDIEVIDDDLGRSASGMVARPGFDRLVAWLCAGEVGAVLCFDASRLARNGRDWHHLLELCGLVEARVIDLDGVYDPCRPNDRLLLGMKGNISEFELGVMRARMLDSRRDKARRGELRIAVPVGYIWHREIGLGLDPDLRLQEAIRLIFSRFRELGSARQVLLSMTADQVHFPRPSDGKRLVAFDWTPIRYRNVITVLKNPFYAGVYAYGKTERHTEIVDGRPRKSHGHSRPVEEWEVMLKDHHEGYIDWAEFERNQKQLAANTYGKVGVAKSGRGGTALLTGLPTCGRCGRRLTVRYAGSPPGRPFYRCDRPNLSLGLPRCVVFGGSGEVCGRARRTPLNPGLVAPQLRSVSRGQSIALKASLPSCATRAKLRRSSFRGHHGVGYCGNRAAVVEHRRPAAGELWVEAVRIFPPGAGVAILALCRRALRRG
jgi:DNA invertase Pin-like site-specific DNA recombinase